MSDQLSPSSVDLDGTRQLLDDLFEIVSEEEGTLAGGTAENLYEGGEACQGLRETKITFGDPLYRLTRLTPRLFDELGIELDPFLKEHRKQYDIYYMVLVASLSPKRGATFQRVECELQFDPQGTSGAIVETIFPQTKWRTVLEWGGGLNLGLNGRLDWEVGLPDAATVDKLKKFEGTPTANLKNNNELKAHIVVPDYQFNMGRLEVSATGEGNNYCRWRIEDPKLQETEEAKFVIVFGVPKGTTAIDLTGTVVADTKMSWLTAQLNSVFGALSDNFKKLWQPGARLPIGVRETWQLTLPE